MNDPSNVRWRRNTVYHSKCIVNECITSIGRQGRRGTYGGRCVFAIDLYRPNGKETKTEQYEEITRLTYI